MPRRQSGNVQFSDTNAIVPIKLCDAGWIHSKLFEDRTDFKRSDPLSIRRRFHPGQLSYGICAEMVEVIVRHDHDIDWR